MLPRWHVLLGLLFALALFPFLSHLAWIVFIASVAIDIDHYFFYICAKKSWSLWKAYLYELHLNLNVKEIKKPRLMIFHVYEFLIIFLIVSFLLLNITFIPLLICIGFCFHVLIDFVFDLMKIRDNKLRVKARRKFSFIMFIKQIKH